MAIRLDNGERLYRSADLLNSAAPYTIMLWVNFVSLRSANQTFCTLSTTSTTTWWQNSDHIELNSSNVLQLAIGSNGEVGIVSTSITPVVDRWYCLAMVRESATSLKLYVDGILKATNTRDSTTRAALTVMNFGVSGDNGNYTDVRFGGIKAWQTAFNLNAIRREMAALQPFLRQNLYAFWPCLPENRLLDVSGNARLLSSAGTITDDIGMPPIRWITAPIIVSAPAAAPASSYVPPNVFSNLQSNSLGGF